MFWPEGYAQISCNGNELQLLLSMILFFWSLPKFCSQRWVPPSPQQSSTASVCVQVMQKSDLMLHLIPICEQIPKIRKRPVLAQTLTTNQQSQSTPFRWNIVSLVLKVPTPPASSSAACCSSARCRPQPDTSSRTKSSARGRDAVLRSHTGHSSAVHENHKQNWWQGTALAEPSSHWECTRPTAEDTASPPVTQGPDVLEHSPRTSYFLIHNIYPMSLERFDLSCQLKHWG